MHMGTILPAPTDPRVAQLLATVALFERDAIEEAVDAFIALLDATTPDPDLEPTGDEHDASWPENRRAAHDPMMRGAAEEDSEEADEPEEDDDDTACDDRPIDGETDTEGKTNPEWTPEEPQPVAQFADDAGEEDLSEVRDRVVHRDRIRARCGTSAVWGNVAWLVPARPAPASFGRRA